MPDESTLVMTATVSCRDGAGIAVALKGAGFAVYELDDADHADGKLDGHAGASVLVIDAGLLHMPHDPQWRALCARRPRLGVVVRSLIRRDPGLELTEDGSLLVHPDNDEGLLCAVRSLGRCTAAA